MSVERAPTPASSGLFATRHSAFKHEGEMEHLSRMRLGRWRGVDHRRAVIVGAVIVAIVVGSFLGRWAFTTLW